MKSKLRNYQRHFTMRCKDCRSFCEKKISDEYRYSGASAGQRVKGWKVNTLIKIHAEVELWS